MAESEEVTGLAAAIREQTAALSSIVNVQAVSFKAPAFWTTNAAAWFTRLEASFATHHPAITNDLTKFQHVIQLLDSETSRRVQAILSNPPEANKYEALKSALLSTFELSQFQKDSMLLQLNGLGDRRPSELLQYMRGLNSDPHTLFRCLFLHQLPVDIRGILAHSPNATLDELAVTADRIMDTKLPSSVIAASHSTDADTDLQSNDELDINALRPTRKATTKKQSSSSSTYILCRYHIKFGPKAKRCENMVNGQQCAMKDLQQQLPIAAAGSYGCKSSTISVSDLNTGRSFLVDTGAEESVYPASIQDRRKRRGPNLVAANGTSIATYGKKAFRLKLGKGETFTQEFWLANVTQPILGADFFAKHHLAIDLANQRLISLDNKLSSMLVPPAPHVPASTEFIHNMKPCWKSFRNY